MQLKRKSISITRYTFVISGNAFAGLFVIKIAEDRFIFEWSFRIILFTSVKRIQADFGSVPYGVSYF